MHVTHNNEADKSHEDFVFHAFAAMYPHASHIEAVFEPVETLLNCILRTINMDCFGSIAYMVAEQDKLTARCKFIIQHVFADIDR